MGREEDHQEKIKVCTEGTIGLDFEHKGHQNDRKCKEK